MHSKRITTILLPLLLLLVAVLLLHPPNPQHFDLPPDIVPTVNGKAPESQMLAPDGTRLAKLPSSSWKPATVFRQVASPSPQHPFPRGEHQIRRYHQPVGRDVAPVLSFESPSVLAKMPEDGRLHLLPGESDTHTLAAIRMVFDPTALDRIVEGKTSLLHAPTATGELLTLEFRKIKTRSATTHTLQGHVAGEESSSIAQIVYHDGILHGSVMRYASNQELEYRILADGHMQVREIDHSIPHDPCATCQGFMADMENNKFPDAPAPLDLREDGGVIAESTPTWRTIDVVVGYSQEARILDGGVSQIEARIIAEVDRMTLAFANSQIADTEMMLLGTIEDTAYVAPGSNSANLGDELINLRNLGDGVLEAVTDLGARLGADLVTFVTPSSQGGQAGVANGGNRYSIISRASMTASQMVLAHEMGHNMGCGHAWGDSSKPTASNTGWRFKTSGGAQLTTIMAYTDGWGSRVPYFSNPNVLYDGVRTGAVNGYNATGDTTADPRLVVGGLKYGPTDFGFDGNTPGLGANNAEVIDAGVGGANNGATVASNWATRTTFEVINPVAGSQWERGTTQVIRFNGGDMEDLAAIQLYKGGVFHSTIANGLNPATNRNFPWNVPFALDAGTDYMIRVELNSNGTTLTTDSGIFTVFSDPPYVTTSAAPAVPEGVGVVSKVVLTFNVPMDTATFSAASDIVSFTDPIGNSVLPSITETAWSAGNTILTIDFTPLTQPGTYQLVVGPNIADTVGSLMDQDQDGASGEGSDDRYIAQFTVNPPVIYQANMDIDPGWTFSHPSWAYGQPTGQGANPFAGNDPTAGFSGSNAIGYNLNGDYESSINPTRWATTPPMNCTGYGNVTLNFKRWLGVAGFDDAYLQVSNNGTSWTTVWSHADNSNLDDGAWVDVSYDISAVAAGQATVFIRWGMGVTDASSNYCGWNIDDVLVSGALSDALAVTSSGGLVSSGVYGGPFTPASIQYTLQNTGAGQIQWTAGKTTNWVGLSATSGTLAAGESTMVTVTINNSADELEIGDYSDLVTFTNATKGIASATRSVDLDVRGPGTLEVGPVDELASSGIYGGATGFSPSSIVYTLTNGGVTPINWTAAKSQSWVTLSATSGTLAPAESTTVTVSINTNANALSPGAYTDAVAFLNTTNENGNTSRAVSLLVNPSAASFYWDDNGSTAGAGGTPTGNWGTDNNWNTNSTGSAGSFSNTTANTADLFFVAGPASNSGNGNTTIAVNGAQVANSITSQHSGNFTLSGGTSITLGNANAGQGGITVSEFAYGTTAQGKLTIPTPVILNNSQTWTNNKVDTSALQQSAGLDLTASNTNSLTLNHPLIIDGKGVTSLSANANTTISGTGSITKNGTGTLILSNSAANNSGWSGGLTINHGEVRYQDAANLGTGNINITGGVLEGRSNSTASNFSRALGSAANQIRISGGVSGFSAQSLTTTTFAITGTLTWGSTNFNPSEFVLQASTANTTSAATFTSSINLNGAERTIRSDQPGSLTSAGVAIFSGALTGTGASGIIKAGPGHVYFTGDNTYAGITRVNNGTLTLQDISAAPGRNTPGKIVVAGGATLGVLGGSYGSIDTLRGNVTWSDKTSRLGFMLIGGTSTTYSSNITQEISVHKYGNSTGALTLTGNSSYTGHTIISQGILAFNSIANVGGGNSALGAPTTVAFGTIALGAENQTVTLRYTGTGHSTDRVINLSGTTGTATLDMSGTGTLTFTSALTATGAGSKTLTLTGSTAGTGVLQGAIPNHSATNITSVTKTGTGTWTLSGNNTYTGATTINAGKLIINGNQSTATGNVSVAANATLGGTGILGGNTTIASTGKLEFDISTPNTSHDKLELATGKSLTFSGASTLVITSSSGAVPGLYTLVTGGNPITYSTLPTLSLPTDWVATVQISGNSLLLDVTSIPGASAAIVYDANGATSGTVPVDGNSPYNAGSTVTVLGNTGSLAKTGHSFAGWNTAADGTGTARAPGSTFTLSSDTTLYALWTVDVVNVVTDVNTLTIPEGNTNSLQVKLSAQPAENITVTVARTSGDTDITVPSGASLTFTTTNWDTYQTVTLAAADDADATEGTATITCEPSDPAYAAATVTATEVEQETTLIVASDGNGTTSPSGAVIVEKGAATPITATPDEGYDFVNWTVTSGTATLADANAASTTATLTAPATVQANFAIQQYTVTFDPNGGDTPSPATKDVSFGSTYGTLATVSRDGYSFIGWFTAAEGGTQVTAATTVTATANHTLYAQWSTGVFMTWDANGTGSDQTNGGGDWLGTNLWWNGSVNTNWVSGATATFGGPSTAGGNVTLASPTTAASIVFNAFTGTYNLGTAGQMITIANGITLNPDGRAVTFTSPVALSAPQTWLNNSSDGNIQMLFNSTVNNGGHHLTIGGSAIAPTRTTANVRIAGAVSGDGGLVKTGNGVLWLQATPTYGGPTTIQGGILRFQNGVGANLPGGNIVLHGGVMEAYWNDTFTRSLGTAAGQFRIPGGISGFSEHGGATLTVRINNSGSFILEWGSEHFNPSKFVLQEYTGDSSALTTLDNGIDLNGAIRTIVTNKTSNPSSTSAGAFLARELSNTNETPSGLIKEGAGLLRMGVANTYNGPTTIAGGTLALENPLSMQNSALDTGASVTGSTTAGLRITPTAITLGGLFGDKDFTTLFRTDIGGFGTLATLTLKPETDEERSYSGAIANGAADMALVKSGAGTQILSGPNTYTGTTTLSAGKLIINGDQSTATGDVSVAANATLGGTGILGGNTIIAASGHLEFDISTPTASHDKLEMNTGKSLTFSGSSVLTITSSGGTPSTGPYTLLTAPGGITGSAPATLNLPSGWAATVSIVGNDLVLNVTSVGTLTPFQTWVAANGIGADADPDATTDGDTLTNLQEYAFGMNPSIPDSGVITFDGNSVTAPGTPTVWMHANTENTIDIRAVFGRRKDYLAAGLVYELQFASELDEWVTVNSVPTVMTEQGDDEVNAVYIPYPQFILTSRGFEKPKFFRVGVSLAQ